MACQVFDINFQPTNHAFVLTNGILIKTNNNVIYIRGASASIVRQKKSSINRYDCFIRNFGINWVESLKGYLF